MKHATECGGSSSEQYLQCTGAKELSSRLPEKPAGEKANIGSALHYVIEQCLNEDEKPEDFIGDEVQLDDLDADGNPIVIEITDEMIGEKVIPALEFFDKYLGEAQFWVEQKIQFPQDKLPGCWGTADIIFKDPERGWGVLDWKFGDNAVSAESKQFQFYLAAALHLDWFGKDAEQFTAMVIQPKEGKGQMHARVYTRKELEGFEAQLLDAYIEHKALEALIEGDSISLQDPNNYATGSACKWCKAKPLCPKKREATVASVKPFTEAHAALTKKQAVKKTVEQVIDGLDIVQTYLDAVHSQTWCNNIIDWVKNEFEQGRPIEGLERIVRSNTRVWSDEKKALGFVRRKGLKATDYYEPQRLKSIPKMEGLIEGGIPEQYIELKPNYTVVKKKDLPDDLDKLSELL